MAVYATRLFALFCTMHSGFRFLLITMICLVSLAGCKQPAYVLQTKPAITGSANAPTISDSLYRAGIDFFATGNLPTSWTLAIDDEDQIMFREKDFAFALLAGLPKETQEKKMYSIKDRLGNMDVVIYNEYCSEGNNKKVEVLVRGTLYTGCGLPIVSSALSNKWFLHSIGGKEIANTKNRPSIEIDDSRKSMQVEVNCKKTNFKMEVAGKTITLSGGKSNGARGCDDAQLETLFGEYILNNSFSYLIRDQWLLLYLKNDQILGFKR